MRSTFACRTLRASIAGLAFALLTTVHPVGIANAAGTASDHPLAARELEAATTRPTKLGPAGPFFKLYPPESCGQTELGNGVFLYVCHVGGRPQEFHLDLAIPGLIVLTGVSLNGETPNLGPSLNALAAELGVTPSNPGTKAPPSAKADASAAQRPPYVGAWGSSQQDCGEIHEFYINTVIGRRRIEQGFHSCTIKASSPIGSTSVLALTCVDPSDPEPVETLARITMETPDRITYERAEGTRESLERCRGRIPEEARAVIDE